MLHVLQVGRIVQSLFSEFDNVDMAPDEFIILTALKYYGAVTDVVKADFAPPLVYPPGTLVNCYPTAVQFPDSDSPHPVTWTSLTQPVVYQVSGFFLWVIDCTQLQNVGGFLPATECEAYSKCWM